MRGGGAEQMLQTRVFDNTTLLMAPLLSREGMATQDTPACVLYLLMPYSRDSLLPVSKT